MGINVPVVTLQDVLDADAEATLSAHRALAADEPRIGEIAQQARALDEKARDLALAFCRQMTPTGVEPEPFAYITYESIWRLKVHGGNDSRGSVPVHAKPSHTARFALYIRADDARAVLS